MVGNQQREKRKEKEKGKKNAHAHFQKKEKEITDEGEGRRARPLLGNSLPRSSWMHYSSEPVEKKTTEAQKKKPKRTESQRVKPSFRKFLSLFANLLRLAKVSTTRPTSGTRSKENMEGWGVRS